MLHITRLWIHTEGDHRRLAEYLPGVWKLRRRSSTGSVGWWRGISLLLGRLPFLASDSALFLQNKQQIVITFFCLFARLFWGLRTSKLALWSDLYYKQICNYGSGCSLTVLMVTCVDLIMWTAHSIMWANTVWTAVVCTARRHDVVCVPAACSALICIFLQFDASLKIHIPHFQFTL